MSSDASLIPSGKEDTEQIIHQELSTFNQNLLRTIRCSLVAPLKELITKIL